MYADEKGNTISSASPLLPAAAVLAISAVLLLPFHAALARPPTSKLGSDHGVVGEVERELSLGEGVASTQEVEGATLLHRAAGRSPFAD